MPAPKPHMTLRQQEAHAKKLVAEWNEKHPVGTTISYEELLGRGETHRAITTSRAQIMCCEAVIFFEGFSGCVSLEHCTAVAAETAGA